MKYLIICFMLVLPTLFAETVPTEKYPWKELDTDTSNILNLIANDKLSESLVAIHELEKKNVGLPIQNCLKSAVFYKILEEYRTRDVEADFNDSAEKAVKALEDESKDKEKGDKYKAKRMQFLGSAYGYRGMYRTLSGLWASAFFDGKRGSDTLEASLVLDPTLLDNKAGIGTYLYWRSAKAGIVKYLFLWGDKKEEGLKNLTEAVAKGKIIKQWALGSLLRIYIEEQKWSDANKCADTILKDVPNDVGTLRRKAMALFMLGKKEDSLNLLKDQLLPLFKAKDNSVLFDKKMLNTANAQIETIYRILKVNSELDKKILDKEAEQKYLSEIDVLKKRITPSFIEIETYVSKVKKI